MNFSKQLITALRIIILSLDPRLYQGDDKAVEILTVSIGELNYLFHLLRFGIQG